MKLKIVMFILFAMCITSASHAQDWDFEITPPAPSVADEDATEYTIEYWEGYPSILK